MRRLTGMGLFAFVLVGACSSSDNSATGTKTSADGGSSGTSGTTSSSSGGPTDPGSDAGTPPTDPTQVPPPTATCTPPVTAVDTSKPDVTLGGAGGPPCTEAGLQTALDQGGTIAFSCGGTATAPFVLTLSAERTVKKDVVIDGGGTVTLSGNKVTRILNVGVADFNSLSPKVTVQNLNFVDGHTTDVPATSSTDHGGAAIYRLGGTLTVIASKFLNNIGPVDGQDVAGGAIYSIGGGATTIVGSTFTGNQCSNGGAVGNLGVSGFTVVNSTFSQNTATGKDANPGDGGNGGAVTSDGPASTGGTLITVSICGSMFSKNIAGDKALGGAIFRTVDTTSVPQNTAPVTIDRTVFDANESASAGALYLHQCDVTLSNSTLSNNVARAGSGGAFWAEGSNNADVTLNLTNVTVANNVAQDGLGGGFFIGGNVGGGQFLHVTAASNSVTDSTGNQYAYFAGGLIGDVSKVKLTNSIFAYNAKPAPVSGDSANCENEFLDGGGNIEFVKDHPDPKRCAANSSLTDPTLTALADNGGVAQTMSVPAANKTITANCTATDERGKPRSAPCAAGAFEPQ